MEDRPTTGDQPAIDEPTEQQQPLPLDPDQTPKSEDPIDDSSEDSFPASDPPSFTRTTD